MRGPWPFESFFDGGEKLHELIEGDGWMLAIPCRKGQVDACVATIAIACGSVDVLPNMVDGHPAVLVEHRQHCRTLAEQDESACDCDEIIVGVMFATEADRAAVIGQLGVAKTIAAATENAYRAGLN